MFHWLCPECGHEIAPGAAECPRCEPSQDASENLSYSSEQTASAPEQADPGSGQPQGRPHAPAPVNWSGEAPREAAEAEWELVTAGTSDPAGRPAPSQDTDETNRPVRAAGADPRMGRRPRRIPPERKRASEQNMPGLQAKPPSWQQSWNPGASQQNSGKKIWKAGVGYVDASEADSGAGANGLSKNLLARPGRAPRRSPRAGSSNSGSARPARHTSTQPAAAVESQPVLGARPRQPELGNASLPGPVSEPGLASPVSLAPETSIRRPRSVTRVNVPQPVQPAPAVPQPPSMDEAVAGFDYSSPQDNPPDNPPQDMEALAVALEDRAAPTTNPHPANTPPEPLLKRREIHDPAAAASSASVDPAAQHGNRHSGEAEPLDRLVPAIPIPTHPVDAPPGPLYGLASVAAHIPAPVTLLRQPEMRMNIGSGGMGAVTDTLLEDPCLRAPEPAAGSTISPDTLSAVTPYPSADSIGTALDTLPELTLLGGEPPEPDSGPEVLRNVAHWLARDLAPAPPPEYLGLLSGEEIQPSMGPVLPVELASLEGAGVSAVLQELSPSREEPKGSPKLNGMVMVAVTVVCLGLSALVFGIRSGSEPEPAPAPEPQQSAMTAEVPPPPPAADEPAPPVEVTGFRLVPGAPGKAEIHYLVVNHNGDAIDPVTVDVTLLSDLVPIPVAEFAFKAPALGPYESREMVSPVEGLSDDIDMSVWRNLTAKVRLADPAGAGE